jgi:hypothetical protein
MKVGMGYGTGGVATSQPKNIHATGVSLMVGSMYLRVTKSLVFDQPPT